jgi:hypothetical protein
MNIVLYYDRLGDASNKLASYKYMCRISRVGAVALYTVLWTVVVKYRT